MTEPMTIEEFIRTKYPPDEQDPFYKQWGYEQWLIKTYKYNIEQLVCLERREHNMYRLALAIKGNGLEHYMYGKPLVRAKCILSGFLMQSVPKGCVGILLWEEDDGDMFCLFASRGGIFGPLMRSFNPEDIEATGLTFKSEQQVIDLCPKNRPTYIRDLERRFVDIPEIGAVYVTRTYREDYACTYYPIEYVPAIAAKTKPWKRKPNAKKVRISLSREQFEEATILWQ